MRHPCHQSDNWWGLAEIFDQWKKFYPDSPGPSCNLFVDFEKGPNWTETSFNRKFGGQFLFDWKAFFEGHAYKISGICGHNVERTEDSIHAWKLRMDEDGKVCLSVSRRSCGPNMLFSNSTHVFKTTPPQQGPAPIYCTDSRHSLAGGGHLPTLLADFWMEQAEHMPSISLAWYASLRDEITMCKFPPAPDAEERARPKVKRVPIVVDLSVAPVLKSAGSGKAARSAARGAVEEGDDDEIEAFDSSDEEQIMQNGAGEEIQWEIESVLDKRLLKNHVEYLVLYKPTPEFLNEPPSWQRASNLNGAEELINAFNAELAKAKAASSSARAAKNHLEMQKMARETDEREKQARAEARKASKNKKQLAAARVENVANQAKERADRNKK